MGRMFIGGRDTTPEIDAIHTAITPRPGESVSHEDVAKVAGVDAGSTRFRTVTERWRRLLERDSDLRVESRDRVFHFLTAAEALERGKTDVHRISRATAKLHIRVAAIDTAALSDEQRQLHGLVSREAQALFDSARRSAKAIQGPKPVRAANLRLAK